MAEGRAADIQQFKRNLQWAIYPTNMIGLPLLVLFIGSVLNFRVGNLLYDLRADKVFLPFSLTLIGGVALSLVLTHFYLVWGFLKPVRNYWLGENTKTLSLDAARAAMDSILATPFRAMTWSIAFYFFGMGFLLVAIQIVYSFTWAQTVMLFIGSVSAGAVVSFFQFFTSKRALHPYMERLVADFPGLALEERYNQLRVGIRSKLLVAIVILCVVLVTLTGVLGYSLSIQAHQMQRGNGVLHECAILAPRLLAALETGASAEELSGLLGDLKRSPDDRILLRNSAGANPLVTAWTQEETLIFQYLDKGFDRTRKRGRLLITRLDDSGVFCGIFNRQRFTLVHFILPENKGDLVFVSSTISFKKELRTLLWFLVIAIVVALFLAFFYTYFAAMEINQPLQSIMRSIQEVAEGNLSGIVAVISQDELGVLARSHIRMVQRLRAMLGRIGEASEGLEKASHQMTEHTEEMASGASTQAASVEETSSAMEEMNQSIQGIAESIETLARSAEESSASILQMSASVEEVAESVGGLSNAVEQTTSSIQEMNASIKEVAENVQSLNQQAGRAMNSLQEMENAIWSVGAGAQDTARLSERVAEDAEQGASSVSKTIAGIGRIRVSAAEAAEVIGSLGRRAKEIGNILTVIEDVTEETNLLALNAAIIAAQAGEHGRGFAVVADEIKDLAERTQASTAEITDLIRAVQEESGKAVKAITEASRAVEEGVVLSEGAGTVLEQILNRIRQSTQKTQEIAQATAMQSEKAKQVMEFFEGVNALISQVATATQQQTRGGDQILRAAQKMEEVSRQVRRATKEQAQGSRQITQAIENISQIVNFINTAQAEQLKGSKAVVIAMQQIRQVADANRDRVQGMTQAMENLKFLADDLRELVHQFQLSRKRNNQKASESKQSFTL
ncbi:MAG: hypothetical protein A2V67_04070 [Deltaproteobacteria bacterium RBG_13_61_14]|nr:MAG: hypothetical protein A2V67_04070 [Deltaproteobacteria bacterium RBG_13_61_14]